MQKRAAQTVEPPGERFARVIGLLIRKESIVSLRDVAREFVQVHSVGGATPIKNAKRTILRYMRGGHQVSPSMACDVFEALRRAGATFCSPALAMIASDNQAELIGIAWGAREYNTGLSGTHLEQVLQFSAAALAEGEESTLNSFATEKARGECTFSADQIDGFNEAQERWYSSEYQLDILYSDMKALPERYRTNAGWRARYTYYWWNATRMNLRARRYYSALMCPRLTFEDANALAAGCIRSLDDSMSMENCAMTNSEKKTAIALRMGIELTTLDSAIERTGHISQVLFDESRFLDELDAAWTIILLCIPDDAAARAWLRHGNRRLQGRSPLDLMLEKGLEAFTALAHEMDGAVYG